MKVVKSKIKRCECVGNFDTEYVYDIGIHDTDNQWVFSNNILIHNSVYCYIDNDHFRKYNPDFVFTRDNIIKYSDEVADKINASFPQYMIDNFHCTEECSKIQKAAKECVASKGLFCGKKRYAMAVYEHDGYRKDMDGGFERKIMGLQVVRSDSPKIIRALLKKMLESVLVYGSKEKVKEILTDFCKNEWNNLKPWEKGKPSVCNKLFQYTQEYKKTGKCSVSQVKGAINWNMLIDINEDKKTPKILDGNKVIVCKLKKNNRYGIDTISYPIDISRLPDWFKSLPFDEQTMKDSIVEQTVNTVFGVLNWDLFSSSNTDIENESDGFLQFVE